MALGSDERERLDCEVRASQELFTQYGGIMGMTQAVLAQPSGITEPRVPQIQEDELCLRNAGVNLRDQARVHNVKYFAERDRQRQQQLAWSDAVDQLVSSITGQAQSPQHVPTPDELQPQDTGPLPLIDDSTEGNQMDTGAPGTETSQSDITMDAGNRAHEVESMEQLGAAKET